MALKTDYKDDVFSGDRKYTETDNSDGTKSFVDETVYSQQGDNFAAADINATNTAVNTNTSNISSLQTRITTAESEVDTLQSQMGTANSNISTINNKLASPTATITINPTDWVDGVYTLNDSRITATSNQEFLPPIYDPTDGSGNQSEIEALQAANLQDGGQSVGQAKIICMGTVPTITVHLRVIFRGEK